MSAPLTILRSDYLQVVRSWLTPDQLQQGTITKSVLHCAAKLLGIFERLMHWKQEAYKKQTRDCWFWIPILRRGRAAIPQPELMETASKSLPFSSLYAEMQGEHCKDVIRSALRLLEKAQVLARKHNPYNGQDRTFWYQLNLEKLACDRARLEAAEVAKTDLKPSQGAIDYIPPLEGDIPLLKGEISPLIYSEINSDPFSETTIAVASKFEDEPIQSEHPRIDQAQPRLPGRPVQPQKSGEDLISSEAAAALRDLKIDLNPSLRREIKAHPDRVENAISVVQQEMNKRWVLNPGGVFVSAMRSGRKPQAKESSGQNGSDRVFVAPAIESERTPDDLLKTCWAILQVKLEQKNERGIKESLDSLLNQGKDAIVHQLISCLRGRGSLWSVVRGQVRRLQPQNAVEDF